LEVISEKPWRIDAVARLFLGLMATICAAQLFGIALPSKKIKLSEEEIEFAQMALTAVFFQGAALIWVGFFLREAHISWREAFGLEVERQQKAVPWGILAALLFLPVGVGLQYLSSLLLSNPVAQEAVQALENADVPMMEQLFMGALAVLLAPVAEEVLFRGILYPTIKQIGYPRLALWVTSLLFGLMHFNLASFAPLTVFSLLLIYLYEKTGSLWASITAHSLFNLTNFALVLLTAGPAAPHSVK
jgi:membrane protease YdiL (CAAX protease family)